MRADHATGPTSSPAAEASLLAAFVERNPRVLSSVLVAHATMQTKLAATTVTKTVQGTLLHI